jgi:Cytidylyltransferase-like
MFISELFEQTEKRNLLVIYPGRFHPFHKGHRAVYDYLVKKYGKNNVFIATSGKVDLPKSPFTFDEKLKMMELTGVDPSHVVQCKSPYRPDEILQNYDQSTISLIMAVSEKDMAEDPRFSFKPKKDGSPTYMQPLEGTTDLQPATKHAYLEVVPTFSFKVLGKPAKSASELRAQFSSLDNTEQKEFIKDLFGKYSPEIHEIMSNRLNVANELT